MKKSASERYFRGRKQYSPGKIILRDAARACKKHMQLRKAVSNTPRRKNEGKKMSVFLKTNLKMNLKMKSKTNPKTDASCCRKKSKGRVTLP